MSLTKEEEQLLLHLIQILANKKELDKKQKEQCEILRSVISVQKQREKEIVSHSSVSNEMKLHWRF